MIYILQPNIVERTHESFGRQTLGREDPLEREWQPTPVFLPGKFRRQRSLSGYSPWGHKELDTTDQLTHI